MVKINISQSLEKKLLKLIANFFKNSRTYNYKEVAKSIKKDLGILYQFLILLPTLTL